MTATILDTAVDVRLSLAGSQWCFAKIINQTTTERISNDEINCGHVDDEVEGGAVGRELVKFILFMDIHVPLLEALLPHMGSTLDTGVYEFDLSLSSFATLIDYGATTHKYSETWITRAIFRGGVSTLPVSLELHCIAVQEEDEASPTFTPGDMEFIYGFPGALHTVAGTSYDIANFALIIDRALVPDWNASNYITGIGRGKRKILLATSTPYLPGKKALYWGNKTYILGRDVRITLTNGTKTILFKLPLGRAINRAPSVENQTEPIRLPVTWEGLRQVDPANDALTVTITTL